MYETIIILPIILLIFLIGFIHYICLNAPSSAYPSLNPTAETNRIWNIERRNGFVISFEIWTSTLNELPKTILNKSNINVKKARGLKLIYNFGIGLCLLGLLSSIIGSTWFTWIVWKDVWNEIELHTLQKVNSDSTISIPTIDSQIVKRALSDNISSNDDITSNSLGAMTWNSAGGLQPLIPGLTMPWTHLPTLILALVVNQLIHEFGHAISAALDDVQPCRFSISLHAVLPSMMVSFPSSIDTLDPNAKMRLATSGPFHNLITWFVVWLITFSGVGNLLWYDRSKEGRVVQDVHWNSPLYPHLLPGTLITHLDDISLVAPTSNAATDTWTEFLSSGKMIDQSRGWCMDKNVFLSQPDPFVQGIGDNENELLGSILNNNDKGDCKTNETSKIIFESKYGITKGISKCLYPNPILNIKSTKCPCPDSKWVCIRPSPKENILRITTRVEDGNWNIQGKDHDKVIFYTGPKEEILRDVRIDIKSARYWKNGIRWFVLFFNYTSTISLSLFLFNLLPLPLTDGSQLLNSLLQWQSTVRPKSIESVALKGRINNKNDMNGSSANIKLYREYEIDSDEEDDQDEEERYIGTNPSSRLNERFMEEGRSSRKKKSWKRWLRRSIQWYTMLIVGLWSLGWGMLFLLRSS
ncbi:uncharacterized protein L201_006170 [Kwoniella dendrophila CBS 6074]|uniref:Endopeptidase S2P n=1 Tax=Kwoniella dendrophila CBS 6074 TaxID=1295534 RepID=A0AAX4K3B8_9TREE